jgi:selenocysteine lyase/cysteine desulfurase
MSRHALVHAVHGSKTGLILPELAEIDRLQRAWGEAATFVIDACQARITTEALHEYLDREAIVFLTGSKFMGGPPFNGFAVIPAAVARRAGALPAGLAGVFSRAEWPAGWPGRETLADEGNPGLWLRFEASIFELERFQALPMSAIDRVIAAFQHALRDELAQALELALVRPSAPGESDDEGEHPIEMRTLVTLDVSGLPSARRFEDAQRVHRELALAGIRLGQPARCVRTDGLEWGGTLRVGLSMPQIVEFAALDDGALRAALHRDMRRIADALKAAG